jgi:hypothetical protein
MEMLLADACTTATMPSFAQLVLLLFFNFKLTILFSLKKLTFNEHYLVVGNVIDAVVPVCNGTNLCVQLLIKSQSF